jgi:hypothetical protein
MLISRFNLWNLITYFSFSGGLSSCSFTKKIYEHVNFVVDRTNGKHLSMLLRLFVPLIEGRTCALKVATKSNSNN